MAEDHESVGRYHESPLNKGVVKWYHGGLQNHCSVDFNYLCCMKKICTTCKKEKEIDDFPINKTKKDGRSYTCRECHKEYNKTHYRKNKSKYVERAQIQRKTTRDWFHQYKQKLVCKLCGDNRWWVLEFHHNSPTKKEYAVSAIVGSGILRLNKEIEKCSVLCANCHRNLHYNQRVSQGDN